PNDLNSGGAVEEWQNAVDGVESLVTRDASGERIADHAPEQLSDVSVVLRGPERHEHLRARAVPSSRDGVLGDENAHMWLVLHALRFDPLDLPRAELLRGVIAEHMPHRRGTQVGILAKDRVERHPDVVRVRRVRCLQYQERLYGLEHALRAS